jgi:hypothetical protein
LQIFGHAKIGLVERQRLDDRRVLGEDLAYLPADRLVPSNPGWSQIRSRHWRFAMTGGITERAPNFRAS